MVSSCAVRSEERADEYEHAESEEEPDSPRSKFSAFRIHVPDAYCIVTALRTPLRIFHLLPPLDLQ